MRVMVAFLLLAIRLPAQDSKAWLEKGIAAYKTANYPPAVEAFEKAVELNPSGVEARLYLALSWFQQYIPGAESPENLECARKAQEEFTKVLESNPENTQALQSLAALSFYQKRWDDAISWNKKVISVEPRNKEAYYTLGVIAWSQFYPKYGAALARMGMTPDSPGPLPASAAKLKLKDDFSAAIDAGIASLEKALAIDPDYDDVMAYMNLLIRERGDLLDTRDEWEHAVAEGDEWVQKCLDTKRKKAAAAKREIR
jgi:tetratricopeptide (TPR) repeat protein